MAARDRREVDPKVAAEAVQLLHRPDGSEALRPVHTIGIGATGHFEASPVAARFCIADHFRGARVAVTLRFSNGSGSAVQRDSWSDIRGMATRFHLSDGTATDLVAMTLPEFFISKTRDFADFAKASAPRPYSRASSWEKIRDLLHMRLPKRNPYPGETISVDDGGIAYADAHPEAQLAIFETAQIGAPDSYVRAAYHAVHTFIVTGQDGTRRWVRFHWQPIKGVLKRSPREGYQDDYLHAELRERLAGDGAARFSLMMSIGEAGDAFDDPTRPWPPHRVRVMMGTLTVDGIPEDQLTFNERLSFNPMLLTTGIEPSDDEILWLRKAAYRNSSERRGAIPCPFHARTDDV
jgi:catalase